jgi:hypothetical protein
LYRITPFILHEAARPNGRSLPEIIPFASGHGGLGTGLATRAGDDAGLQLIVPNRSEESVPDSGSPALLMIQGCQPARNSSFSREFPAAWTPRKADIIKSAGEPKERTT